MPKSVYYIKRQREMKKGSVTEVTESTEKSQSVVSGHGNHKICSKKFGRSQNLY